jgi:hypothetical protein
MARTVEQIVQEMITAKEAKPELAGLTSTSVTAIWRLWIYVFAMVVWAHEKFFDQYKIDLQALVDANIIGTGSWYAQQLLKFQLGDTLEVLPSGKLGYLANDDSKKIVKRSSYQEQPGSLLLLKAAKEVSGAVVPLTATELTQLKGYVERVRFAGVNISVISENADKLRPVLDVYYNSLISPLVFIPNVEAAISSYCSQLDFDGFFYVSKMVDAIQAVEGVIDVKVNTMTAVSSVATNTFDRIYRTRSGYIEPDTESGYTLADLITYVAQ